MTHNKFVSISEWADKKEKRPGNQLSPKEKKRRRQPQGTHPFYQDKDSLQSKV